MFTHRTQPTYAASAYLALTVAMLLLGLLWLLQPAQTSHAQSQPEALGSVSGTVRNAQGDPLPNINVAISQYDLGPIVRTATTSVQGVYHIPSLPPGTYTVRFEDNSKYYATTYYANSSFLSEADAVNVSGNSVTGIDVEMIAGGTISVTVEPAIPITNSSLFLALYGKTSTGRWEIYDTINWPWTDKELTFYGLPMGTYRLCARPSIYPNFRDLAECYDNTFPTLYDQPPVDATDIVMSGTEQITIALRFEDFSQLQGIVQSTSGESLPNIQLYAYNEANKDQRYAMTDAQGRFRFDHIFDGSYTLQAIDIRNEFLPIFYNAAPTSAQAQRLNIVSTSRYSLTLTMQPSGRITGMIRIQGGGIPTNASITPHIPLSSGAWGDDTSCPYNICSTSYEPTTGVYTITGLTTGKYRIRVTEWYGLGGQVTGFYGGNNLQNADDVLVTTGETTPNINVTLGAGAFEGTIMGTATANGVPQRGIDVGLFSSDFYYGQPQLPFVSTTTDAQGHYRFDGLTSGSYHVGFRDPQGDYATIFYGGSFTQPAKVIITGSMTIDNVDGALSPGSTIRGRIKRAVGNNPADFRLLVRVVETGTFLPYLDVLTDAKGNYEITGLAPGTYRVAASSPIYLPWGLQYRFYPFGRDESEEGNIVVSENVIIEGIDIPIDTIPSAYLPIIGGSGLAPD